MRKLLRRIPCASFVSSLTICAAVFAAAGEKAAEPVQGKPLFQSDQTTVRDINEITKDFRQPTANEIKILGTFWHVGPKEENAAYWFALAASHLHVKDAPAGSALASYDDMYSYAGDLAVFGKWVESTRPGLDTMREGFKRQAYCAPIIVYAPKTVATFDVVYFSKLRNLARASTDAGLLDELNGRPDAAAESYLDCIRLAMAERRQPAWIEDLNAIALMQMGTGALDTLVAGGRLNERTLRTVIATCRQAETEQKKPLVVWERNTALNEACIVVHGSMPKEEELAWAVQRRYEAAVQKVLARRTLDDLLQKRVLEDLYKNALKEFAKENGVNGIIHIDTWIGALGRTNVYLRVAEIRAGLAVYQMKHGSALPDTLDALCPDILPSVPTDPFSGKPMRYAKTADGFKIWSVGQDNVDNGGQGDTQYSRRWNEPDAVFVSNVPSNVERRSAGSKLSGKAEK